MVLRIRSRCPSRVTTLLEHPWVSRPQPLRNNATFSAVWGVCAVLVAAERGLAQPGSVKGMLSVRVDRPAEDVVVVAVAGEIDSVTAPKLSTFLHRELEGQPAALILDLTAVSFLGVAGLHVLDCALDRSKTLSVALSVVHHEESPVQSALRAAAMTGDFPTFRTVTQARTSSGPVPTTR